MQPGCQGLAKGSAEPNPSGVRMLRVALSSCVVQLYITKLVPANGRKFERRISQPGMVTNFSLRPFRLGGAQPAGFWLAKYCPCQMSSRLLTAVEGLTDGA